MNRHPALLVIDVQNFYCTVGSGLYVDDCEAVIIRINRLIEAFQKKHLPIFYIKHMYRPDGADAGRMWDYSGTRKASSLVEGSELVEHPDNLKLVPHRYEIDKHRYSSFKQTELQQMLVHAQVDTVVITGFMTNFCCETTAREAHDLDYYVYFLTDATSCPKNYIGIDREQVKAVVHATMASGFAVLRTTDDYLKTVE